MLALLTGVRLSLSEKFSLPADYSVEVLPPTEAEDSPLELLASVNLRNILDVMETKQQISLEITLRYYWRDPRIVPVVEHLNEEDSYGGYVNLHPGNSLPQIFIFSSHFNRRDKEDLDAGHLHRPGHQPAETHLLPHTSLPKVSSEQPPIATSKVKQMINYPGCTMTAL